MLVGKDTELNVLHRHIHANPAGQSFPLLPTLQFLHKRKGLVIPGSKLRRQKTFFGSTHNIMLVFCMLCYVALVTKRDSAPFTII